MDDAGDVGSPTEALVKEAAKEYALEVSQCMMGVVLCWPTDLFVNRRRGCIPLQAHSLRPRHAPHTSVGSHSVHPSVVSSSLLITSVLLLISMASHTQADRHHTSYTTTQSLTERALHFFHTRWQSPPHRSTHRVSHMYIISLLNLCNCCTAATPPAYTCTHTRMHLPALASAEHWAAGVVVQVADVIGIGVHVCELVRA